MLSPRSSSLPQFGIIPDGVASDARPRTRVTTKRVGPLEADPSAGGRRPKGVHARFANSWCMAPPMPASPIRILWLDDPKARDPALVGGKAAALAHLRSRYPVPPGFVVPWTAFGSDGRVPVDPVIDAYRRLHAESVAVRSSAVDEDGREASFAGQHTTVLHVRDAAALVEAVRSCRESGRSEAALAYRRHLGVADEDPARVAVLVQTMVRADAAAIGFSRAPAAFGHDVMLINAGFGLGDSLASGRV